MKWIAGLCCLLLLLCACLRTHDRFFSTSLRILFFDVGQGDATLIRFPGSQNWLVDGGGGWKDWDRGNDLVLELARMGILKLDVALLSHPDLDHGMGLRGVLRNLRVREFWWNGIFAAGEHPLLRELLSIARSQGSLLVPWSARDGRTLQGVAVQILPLERGRSKNDRVLALLLEYAGCRVLLAGDAEKKAEESLRSEGRLDLWKVHHHGSRTSSSPAFLEATRPRWSVISSGVGNEYGHPSPVTLERLRAMGTQVLRTDFHGYVEVAIDPGGVMRCRSALGDCGQARCARP